MFLNYLLVTMYFPEPWSWVIHLVVGLFCGIGIDVPQKLVMGWPLCQDV
jgi:hypothetical protein